MSNNLYEMEDNVQTLSQDVAATDLPFNFKATGRRWEKEYGITEVPLLVRSAEGKVYDDRKHKGIFVNGKYRRIVSRQYTVFPNEEADKIVTSIINKPDSGLTIKNVTKSHGGDAWYWHILSNRFEQVKPGDEVQLGFIVRNSLGTNVALGADLFTYRLICANGAIARGQDLGTIAIRHISNVDSMRHSFTHAFLHMIDMCAQLVGYYRQAALMEMNKIIAEAFAKKIPQQSFPKCMEMDENTKKVKFLPNKKQTVWEAFNDITEDVWHNQKSGFLTKSFTEQRAHTVLVAAVQQKIKGQVQQ